MDTDDRIFLKILKYITFSDDDHNPSIAVDDVDCLHDLINQVINSIRLDEVFENKVLYNSSRYIFNIYKIKPESTIIDHDHPGKQAISFVISGSCKVRSLTLLENKQYKSYLSLNSYSNYEAGDIFSYGRHHGNIHGLKSEQGACLFTICQLSNKDSSVRHYYIPVKTKGNLVTARRMAMKNKQSR